MKKSAIWILLLISLSLTGCDFLRRVAGRPTSADIELRREAIAAEERAEAERHAARMDSIRRVRQQMEDSLSALENHLLDSLSKTSAPAIQPSKLGGLSAEVLTSRYYIVAGAFRSQDNAARKKQRCDDAGYPATVVQFKNGFYAVTLCPSDNLRETVNTLNRLRKEGVCPPDGWILFNE